MNGDKKRQSHQKVLNYLDEFIDSDYFQDEVVKLRITKDTYDTKHQEYADKLQLLNIELAEHTNADYEYQTVVATALSVAHRAKAIFEGCSEPAQKRAFLNYLLQNSTIRQKTLSFQLRSPFDLILDLSIEYSAPRPRDLSFDSKSFRQNILV